MLHHKKLITFLTSRVTGAKFCSLILGWMWDAALSMLGCPGTDAGWSWDRCGTLSCWDRCMALHCLCLAVPGRMQYTVSGHPGTDVGHCIDCASRLRMDAALCIVWTQPSWDGCVALHCLCLAFLGWMWDTALSTLGCPGTDVGHCTVYAWPSRDGCGTLYCLHPAVLRRMWDAALSTHSCPCMDAGHQIVYACLSWDWCGTLLHLRSAILGWMWDAALSMLGCPRMDVGHCIVCAQLSPDVCGTLQCLCSAIPGWMWDTAMSMLGHPRMDVGHCNVCARPSQDGCRTRVECSGLHSIARRPTVLWKVGNPGSRSYVKKIKNHGRQIRGQPLEWWWHTILI